MNMLRRYAGDERGSTAVEFGMVSMFFLVMLFGTIELGRIYWTWNALQYAIESTARYALAHQAASNSALATYAAESMAGIQVDTAALTVTTSQTTISGISFIQVNGTYAFHSILPLLPNALNTVTLTAKAQLPYAI